MARFQLQSGRVKGFICRKHMATQNPIRQMPELLNAGREISDSKKDCHQSDDPAGIMFHCKPKSSYPVRASQFDSISCLLLSTINVAQKNLISLSKGFTLRINCTF